MIDSSKLDKLYYTIGEVAEMFGVSRSLIRYWESEFTSLKPIKNSKGDRRFTKQNIEQLNQIFHLVKEKGFTIDGAKGELKDLRKNHQQENEIAHKLQALRSNLVKWRNGLK